MRTDVGAGFLQLAQSTGYIELKSGVDIAAIAKIGGKKKGTPFETAKKTLEEHL